MDASNFNFVSPKRQANFMLPVVKLVILIGMKLGPRHPNPSKFAEHFIYLAWEYVVGWKRNMGQCNWAMLGTEQQNCYKPNYSLVSVLGEA